MIKLKEWVITKLIIEVTNEWIPYDWEVSFGIYNKKWDIVRQKEVEVEWWVAEITVPKIKENDYRFTLETDDGYSDIQDLIVSKSVRTPTTEVTRKYQIDINNERDEKYEKNIGKNKILMNEFYMNNGKRIKKLESDIEEHKGRMDMDKWEMMECIGKGKEEMKKELEDFSKVIGSKIEWVSRELVSFEKSSEQKTDMIIEELETFKTDTDDKFNQTEKTINTITETIWDISKKNNENGLSMSEKITRIENKIPTGWILDYEVDDEWLSTKILWTSDKIDKRIRWEVGRQKKYVSYQNMFDTIAVSWQDSLQPTSPLDELTLVWVGVTITTDTTTNTLTITWWWGSWDVVWPAGATDWNIALYDWATGKLIKNSTYSPASFAAALWADDNYVTDAEKAIISATTASFTTADETKLDYITVTQAVDLDTMEADIAALANGMVYKGNWDASAWNFPWAWVAQIGWFYTVSVWGTVDSIVFNIWDRLIATVDNASTTTYVWNWTQLDATDAVTSVNGQTWNVTWLVQYTSNTADLNMWTYDVITDTIRANSSGGLLIESANGTDVGIFWAGNTANVEWYGAHNYSTATQDTIAIFTWAGKTLWSAATATYPSLTELAYVKWVTSAIQTQLNAKLGLSWGTVTWAIVFDENASLQLDWSLSADGKWSGTTITWTAWYTQAFWDLVYLDPTDSRREATDANAAAWADWDCRWAIWMVVSAWTDWTACTILLQGTIRADANFPTFTVWWPIFASETAWDVTQTAPTTSGVVVKAVWRALTTDSMYFNPSANFTIVT